MQATRSLLRLPEVISRTGLGRSSIYAKIATGAFPQPVRLSARAIAFVSEEVDEWISERIAASRSPSTTS